MLKGRFKHNVKQKRGNHKTIVLVGMQTLGQFSNILPFQIIKTSQHVLINVIEKRQTHESSLMKNMRFL